MTTTNSTLRQRSSAPVKKAPTKDSTKTQSGYLQSDVVAQAQRSLAGPNWDYKLALSIITLLAFATRFYGLSHPNEVVFDEVHFGKVSGF